MLCVECPGPRNPLSSPAVCLDLRQPLSLPDQRFRPSRPHGSCMVVRRVHGALAHCCRGSPYLSNRISGSVRPVRMVHAWWSVESMSHDALSHCCRGSTSECRAAAGAAPARAKKIVRVRTGCAEFFKKFSLVRKAGRTEDAVFVCSTGGKAQFRLHSASPS